MIPVDPLGVAQLIAGYLEAAGLRYLIGGSVASSLLGEPRSTLDLDLMIERDLQKVGKLVRMLSETCYIDTTAALAAAEHGRSFNAIHLPSSMKVDFFVAEDAPFAAEALSHRRRVNVPGVGELYFYALEDLIVRKLSWFRLGGESSDRQWRDVVSLLRINAGDIDLSRLQRLSSEVGIADLLARALRES